MNTSLLFRSLSLALTLVMPALASTSNDLVTLDSIIAGPRTAPFWIKVGMDQKQVCNGLGAPDVVVGRNLWGYFNLQLHGRPPEERCDALVIFMVDGRVRLLRLTQRTAVLDLVARCNQAYTGGASGGRDTTAVTPHKRDEAGPPSAAPSLPRLLTAISQKPMAQPVAPVDVAARRTD